MASIKRGQLHTGGDSRLGAPLVFALGWIVLAMLLGWNLLGMPSRHKRIGVQLARIHPLRFVCPEYLATEQRLYSDLLSTA